MRFWFQFATSEDDEDENSSDFSASVFDEEEVAEIADSEGLIVLSSVVNFCLFQDDETDEEGDVPDSASSDDHERSDMENSDILVDDYERYNF